MAVLNKDVNSVAVSGGVSDLDGATILPIEINHTNGRIKVSAIISGGSGGFTELPAIGDVDATNPNFVFTQKPTYIVSDGATYKELDNNGNVQWSWDEGTLTATMTIPPNSSIFGWV